MARTLAQHRRPWVAAAAAPLLVALLAGCLAPVPSHAGGDDRRDRTPRHEEDHDRVRAAVGAGEVMPLPALRAQLQRSHPGEILELELEREDDRWIYEVRLLRADGRLQRLELDARTGEPLSKGRRDAPTAKPAR